MEVLEKFSAWVGKHMAAIILAVAALALFKPSSCLWVQTSWIVYLLMIVMFGMGLTLKYEDFKVVFTRPRDVLIGCAAQFIVMPVLAVLLAKTFGLEGGLLAGVALVGACPGGTSSNVITYLSKGDVALSVGMTSVNTLLAPLFTPIIAYLILRQSISVDVVKMFMSIVQVVVLPIALGFAVEKLLGKRTERAAKMLPAVSVFAIAAIVAAVVSHNAEQIFETGALVFVVVFLHNILGYVCGYGVARALKLPLAKKKALAIEIGMQNSGLATSLAAGSFSNLALATVPGAVFSVWHNISGAILAQYFSRMKDDSDAETEKEEASKRTKKNVRRNRTRKASNRRKRASKR